MKTIKPMMNKSFIAKLLALCMIVGLLPTFALAAAGDVSDNTYYEIKADTAGTGSGTVTLTYTVGFDTNSKVLDSAYYRIDADVTKMEFEFKPDSGSTFASATYQIDGDTAKSFTVKDGKGEIPTTAFAGKSGGIEIVVKATFNKTGDSYPGGGFFTPAPSTTVNSAGASNGSFTVSDKNAKAGDTVTVTPNPDEGYAVGRVTVRDKNGNVLKVTEHKDGTFTFEMPDKSAQPVTIEVTFTTPTVFDDVPADTYYTDAVEWAVNRGITDGTGNGTFSPDGGCKRSEIVTFLWRAAGSPEPADGTNKFTDVDEDEYYGKAVLWAIENGITNGMTETTFAPDEVCTRAQTVTFLHRYEGNPEAAGSSFSDVSGDAYYADAVNWAKDAEVANGTGENNFSPDDTCTRAQVVTFLYRDMVVE